MVDEAMRKINELREQIDVLDRDLVKKINQRAKLALEIREIKAKNSIQLYDPGREEEIFAKVTAINNGPLYDDDLRDIYEAILHAMKSFEA